MLICYSGQSQSQYLLSGFVEEFLTSEWWNSRKRKCSQVRCITQPILRSTPFVAYVFGSHPSYSIIDLFLDCPLSCYCEESKKLIIFNTTLLYFSWGPAWGGVSLNWSLDPDIDQTDASGTCIPKEQDEWKGVIAKKTWQQSCNWRN